MANDDESRKNMLSIESVSIFFFHWNDIQRTSAIADYYECDQLDLIDVFINGIKY